MADDGPGGSLASMDQSDRTISGHDSSGEPGFQVGFGDFSLKGKSNSLLSSTSLDKQSQEEKEEDFLIQQTAQRFSEAQSRSNGNNNNSMQLSSAHFRRMSSYEIPTGESKPWHDADSHKEQREQMEAEISRLLRDRKQSPPSEEWVKQLPSKATKLERRLYRSASSLESYLDKKTLKKRLQRVAQEIVNEYNKRKSSSASRASMRISSRGPASAVGLQNHELGHLSQSKRTSSAASADSMQAFQDKFSANTSFAPRSSAVVPSRSTSSMPPPASVPTQNQNRTSSLVGSDRSARIQDAISRLEAKIKDEIQREQSSKQKESANDQLAQQGISDESLLQARLQLQQQQQQQQQQFQQHFASQNHLLSLQPLSTGIGQLRSSSLPSHLSDLLHGGSLQQQSDFSALLGQHNGSAEIPNHIRAQQLLFQQQQQQQQQFQQHRLSLSGLDSFANHQQIENELRLMSQLTGGGSLTSALTPQQILLSQQHHSNGATNSNQPNDAPLSPGALDRFWDG